MSGVRYIAWVILPFTVGISEYRGIRFALLRLSNSLMLAAVDVIRCHRDNRPPSRQSRPLELLLRAIESLPHDAQDELIPRHLQEVLRSLLYPSAQLRPLAKVPAAQVMEVEHEQAV